MKSFYEKLAEHQTTEEWDFREVLENLHWWRKRFSTKFKLEIPECAITIDDISHWHLGHFRPGHNGFGFKGEIALSRRHVIDNLSIDKWWNVLGTLLHELFHAWQDVRGESGAGNYHNVAFRRKASELGLIVKENGETSYAPEGPFLDLVEKQGIEVPRVEQDSPKSDRPKRTSKLRLWMCGCPVKVRVGRREFEACCLRCNQEFELQSPAESHGL